MTHYLDTSVLTAYYSPEPRSASVQRVLSRIEGPTVSPLVEVELYCAIARKVRGGGLEASDARRIFAQFQLHLAEPRFHLVSLQNGEFRLAREWIGEMVSPLRVLDALHLAAAFAHGLCLLTADRELARSARHFGVNHKLVA